MDWISQSVSELPAPIPLPNHSLAGLVIGILSDRTSIDTTSANILAQMVCHLVQNGCIVVIPEFDRILSISEFVANVFGSNVELKATILNAEQVLTSVPGVHIMRRSGPLDLWRQLLPWQQQEPRPSSPTQTVYFHFLDIPLSPQFVSEVTEWRSGICLMLSLKKERTPF